MNNELIPNPFGAFWADAEVIVAYTRADAIADGELVDVSSLATLAGWRVPAAVSASVCGLIQSAARHSERIFCGEVTRLLTFLADVARSVEGDRFFVNWVDHPAGAQRLAVIVGPGDTAEPVLTICQPMEI